MISPTPNNVITLQNGVTPPLKINVGNSQNSNFIYLNHSQFSRLSGQLQNFPASGYFILFGILNILVF